MNIQYAIHRDRVYVLEANPRASRTVPIVSKVCGLSMARLATEIMLGKRLHELGLEERGVPHFGVKQPVFPFVMFPEVDPQLGPEMRSTGEVLGLAPSFGLAFHKAMEGAGQFIPQDGTVLISVCERDRSEILAEAARRFREVGYRRILATEGTRAFLMRHGVECEPIFKLCDGRPNIVDEIKNGGIQLIVNTPAGKLAVTDDSYIRKEAIKQRIPCLHTVAAARAAAEGLAAHRQGHAEVRSLQDYHGARQSG
jgi:carbamoyl-phosphate synthase large subunit